MSAAQLKFELHKYDRLSSSFRAAVEKTREVLFLGLLEVLELSNEGQVALSIDRHRVRDACSEVVSAAVRLADVLRSGQAQEIEIFLIGAGRPFNEKTMEAEGGTKGTVVCTIYPGLRETGLGGRILLKPTVLLE